MIILLDQINLAMKKVMRGQDDIASTSLAIFNLFFSILIMSFLVRIRPSLYQCCRIQALASAKNTRSLLLPQQRHYGNTATATKYNLSTINNISKNPAIFLKDSAINRLKCLSKERGTTQYLRLRVDSGGCYGFSYMLDMTEKPEADDVVIDMDGAKMVVDKHSLPLVKGATIDWQDRLIGQAFVVLANPQASGGCGCGASFEIKLD